MLRHQIRDANHALSRALLGQETLSFFCECDSGDCDRRIDLSCDDYRALHRQPGCFVVASHHLEDYSGLVVEQFDGYALVKESMWSAAA